MSFSSKLFMDFLKNLSVGELHHAYLVTGERRSVRLALNRFFENELKLKIRGNPDLLFAEYDTFTIDEAPALKDWQSKGPPVGEQKFLVFKCRQTIFFRQIVRR